MTRLTKFLVDVILVVFAAAVIAAEHIGRRFRP